MVPSKTRTKKIRKERVRAAFACLVVSEDFPVIQTRRNEKHFIAQWLNSRSLKCGLSHREWGSTASIPSWDLRLFRPKLKVKGSQTTVRKVGEETQSCHPTSLWVDYEEVKRMNKGWFPQQNVVQFPLLWKTRWRWTRSHWWLTTIFTVVKLLSTTSLAKSFPYQSVPQAESIADDC